MILLASLSYFCSPWGDFGTQISRLWKIGVITKAWALWFSRNKCTFDGVKPSPDFVLVLVSTLLAEASLLRINMGYMKNTIQ